MHIQRITLLDFLRIHPNLIEHVFPQYSDIVDIVMLKLAMEFEEAEKQVQVLLEKYVDDIGKRDIFSYNLFVDQYLM